LSSIVIRERLALLASIVVREQLALSSSVILRERLALLSSIVVRERRVLSQGGVVLQLRGCVGGHREVEVDGGTMSSNGAKASKSQQKPAKASKWHPPKCRNQ
jgi:hypothetical protein